VDVLRRRGQLPGTKPGFVPGGEVAGTVVAVGAGVGAAWLGSRVHAGFEGGGGYAEYVATGVGELTPLPPTVSAVHVVALGTHALVATFALRHARLRAGERILVRGASGGIRVLAIQLGAHRGATVAATTSSADRGQRLRQLGASEILDPSGGRGGRGRPLTRASMSSSTLSPVQISTSFSTSSMGTGGWSSSGRQGGSRAPISGWDCWGPIARSC
jgi:NADPH:quinone reductase